MAAIRLSTWLIKSRAGEHARECVKELRDIQSQSMVVTGPMKSGIEAVIDFWNYGTFSRLVGVTAILSEMYVCCKICGVRKENYLFMFWTP